MALIRPVLAFLFLLLSIGALLQCARRGSPSGGPKDVEGPVLLRAEPENFTTNFTESKIRLYFDEYVRLVDVQNQLIISPPMKYIPEITPQGGTAKYVQITIKDTLMENTTYTLNFGQSIVDNNEANPNNFLTYVFSTGDYIDSLLVAGVVKDAYNKEADKFISVMLYEIDSAFTDSTIYRRPPNYITNTLDSTTIFKLQNLKAGTYSLVAIKDEGKNNIFDPLADKIGFTSDTVNLPTDSTYLLRMFKEIPNYSAIPPTLAASNKIIFGYRGGDEMIDINPLSQIPDTIKTLVAKEQGKDSLDYWFTPFITDSLVFEVYNQKAARRDTFTVKMRNLKPDSLLLTPNKRTTINFQDTFFISANIPLKAVDSSKISIINRDSALISSSGRHELETTRFFMDFEKEPEQEYTVRLLPEAFTDFFGNSNDSIAYRLSTGGYADFGNLRLTLEGEPKYPFILQLTNEKGRVLREIYATGPQPFEFNTIPPAKYLVRMIYDANGNGKWDTGNFLTKLQPERVVYYPQTIEVRANWELEQTFSLPD